MILYRLVGCVLFISLLGLSSAQASPLEEAKAMVDEGEKLLAKAKSGRKSKRKELLIRGVGKYARAYLILTTGKPVEGATEMVAKVKAKVNELSERPAIVAARQTTRVKAIDAAAEGRLTDAYDLFARLRDMDPRDQTVEYILGVIGQRMDSAQGNE
jgi:hypothetical protein